MHSIFAKGLQENTAALVSVVDDVINYEETLCLTCVIIVIYSTNTQSDFPCLNAICIWN
jgi:hypothetical protein